MSVFLTDPDKCAGMCAPQPEGDRAEALADEGQAKQSEDAETLRTVQDCIHRLGSAKILLQTNGLYAACGFMHETIWALQRALSAPVGRTELTDDMRKAAWRAQYLYRGGSEHEAET